MSHTGKVIVKMKSHESQKASHADIIYDAAEFFVQNKEIAQIVADALATVKWEPEEIEIKASFILKSSPKLPTVD